MPAKADVEMFAPSKSGFFWPWGGRLQADFGGRFPRNWACLGQWSIGPGLSPESPRIPSNPLESISPAFRLESSAVAGKFQRLLEASKSSSDHENCRNRCIPETAQF